MNIFYINFSIQYNFLFLLTIKTSKNELICQNSKLSSSLLDFSCLSRVLIENFESMGQLQFDFWKTISYYLLNLICWDRFPISMFSCLFLLECITTSPTFYNLINIKNHINLEKCITAIFCIFERSQQNCSRRSWTTYLFTKPLSCKIILEWKGRTIFERHFENALRLSIFFAIVKRSLAEKYVHLKLGQTIINQFVHIFW